MILGNLIIILTLCLLCSHRKAYNHYKSLKILVINDYSFLLQIFNDRSTFEDYLFLLQIINDRSTFRALSHPWSHRTLPQRPHTSRSHFRLQHKAWSLCKALCIEKKSKMTIQRIGSRKSCWDLDVKIDCGLYGRRVPTFCNWSVGGIGNLSRCWDWLYPIKLNSELLAGCYFKNKQGQFLKSHCNETQVEETLLAPSGALIAIPTYYWPSSSSTPTFFRFSMSAII